MSELCPCGSGQLLAQCCEPYLTGASWPEDAEKLMRSRYTAYVLGRYHWLVQTTHPDYLEDLSAEKLAEQTAHVRWLGLDIASVSADVAAGEHGELFDVVEFHACYELEGVTRQLGERSFFCRKDDKMYYVGGVTLRPAAWRRSVPKVGRNDACSCGSGKKYKKCCGMTAC